MSFFVLGSHGNLRHRRQEAFPEKCGCRVIKGSGKGVGQDLQPKNVPSEGMNKSDPRQLQQSTSATSQHCSFDFLTAIPYLVPCGTQKGPLTMTGVNLKTTVPILN